MKITNRHNLPPQIVAAASEVYKPQENRIRVTELVGPAMIRRLLIDEWDNLVQDASERLWAIMGTAIHKVFGDYEQPGDLAEERLNCQFDQFTISGQSDNYSNGKIEDWKFTSMWSFIGDVKPEWECQLNVYAYLWRSYGFPVDRLEIVGLLRDWSKGKSFNSEIPPIPFVREPVRVWKQSEIQQYITDRVKAHKDPQPCTKAERWARPDVYAVMKKGRKSAVRLFYTDQEATEHMNSLLKTKKKVGALYIEHRPGENVRCENYCPVRDVCPHRRFL